MQQKWFWILLAALLLSVAFIGSDLRAFNNKKQQEAYAFFARARDISNLEAKGSPPFVLEAKITLYGGGGSHEDGSYYQAWESDSESRSEISFPGYHAIRVNHSATSWYSSNLAYTPYFVFQTNRVFSFPFRLDVQPTQKLTKPRQRIINGLSAECAGFSIRASKQRYESCFDSATGYLIQEDDPTWFVTFELGDYARVGGKVFPRELRVLQDGRLIVEAKVTKLFSNAKMNENMFASPPGIEATPRAICAKGQVLDARLVTKVPPQYPPDAIRNRMGGTVVLYADVGKDGVPRGLTVLRTPGTAFSQASLAAVSRWRYAPTTCEGVAVDFTMPIDVNFAMRQ